MPRTLNYTLCMHVCMYSLYAYMHWFFCVCACNLHASRCCISDCVLNVYAGYLHASIEWLETCLLFWLACFYAFVVGICMDAHVAYMHAFISMQALPFGLAFGLDSLLTFERPISAAAASSLLWLGCIHLS